MEINFSTEPLDRLDRNPIIKLDRRTIRFVGDPHFGRTFKTGCLVSRQGDREALLKAKFRDCLAYSSDMIIIMGDLFDKAQVNNEVLMSVYRMISESRETNSSRGDPPDLFIIPGNHDVARDTTKVSSYTVLKHLLKDFKGVYVVDDKPIAKLVGSEWIFVFDAYTPRDGSKPVEIPEKYASRKIAYCGHWDDVRFMNTNPDSYLPNPEIADKSTLIISGHIHKPFNTTYRGKPMYYIGSMEPYSFSEDKGMERYVHLNYKDLEIAYEKPWEAKYNPMDFVDKHLKIDAPAGYIYDGLTTGALSILYNPLPEENEFADIDFTALEAGSGDLATIYQDKLKEAEISKDLISKLLTFLDDAEYKLELDLGLLGEEDVQISTD